jgi:hypothetical protein
MAIQQIGGGGSSKTNIDAFQEGLLGALDYQLKKTQVANQRAQAEKELEIRSKESEARIAGLQFELEKGKQVMSWMEEDRPLNRDILKLSLEEKQLQAQRESFGFKADMENQEALVEERGEAKLDRQSARMRALRQDTQNAVKFGFDVDTATRNQKIGEIALKQVEKQAEIDERLEKFNVGKRAAEAEDNMIKAQDSLARTLGQKTIAEKNVDAEWEEQRSKLDKQYPQGGISQEDAKDLQGKYDALDRSRNAKRWRISSDAEREQRLRILDIGLSKLSASENPEATKATLSHLFPSIDLEDWDKVQSIALSIKQNPKLEGKSLKEVLDYYVLQHWNNRDDLIPPEASNDVRNYAEVIELGEVSPWEQQGGDPDRSNARVAFRTKWDAKMKESQEKRVSKQISQGLSSIQGSPEGEVEGRKKENPLKADWTKIKETSRQARADQEAQDLTLELERSRSNDGHTMEFWNEVAEWKNVVKGDLTNKSTLPLAVGYGKTGYDVKYGGAVASSKLGKMVAETSKAKIDKNLTSADPKKDEELIKLRVQAMEVELMSYIGTDLYSKDLAKVTRAKSLLDYLDDVTVGKSKWMEKWGDRIEELKIDRILDPLRSKWNLKDSLQSYLTN